MRSIVVPTTLALAFAAMAGREARSFQAAPPKPARAATPSAPLDTEAATKEIRRLGAEFAKAYEKGDADAVAALFTEDAEITGDGGESIRGRAAIREHFAAAMKAAPGEKMEVESREIRFLGPRTARELGATKTEPKDGGPALVSEYDAIWVRSGDKWLQASVHESDSDHATVHDRLKELEWMLGEWVDESETGAVHTTCRWSEDGNFLLRDFSIRFGGNQARSGTQRIGWDPRSRQFKSWIFDPDGGHSEGSWSRVDADSWMIRTSGVMADGRTVAGTQVVRRIGKQQLELRSYDRSIGGIVVPDIGEITLVRVPPKSGRAAAAPK